MLTWRKKTMEFPTQIPLEPRRKNETTQNYVSRASLALKGILGELCSTNNGYSAMKSATEPFPSRPCLAPHPHSLCFLQGNSNILQWWKDSLIISHTQKKTVIVFRFTWKLMDLGIPDVDVQNPLWSLSGDLSSLGCLWRTPVSAEVICELFHTKSRFFWERQCTHTHTHMHTHSPPPPCPAPCQQVLPQSAATQGGTSCPTGFGGFREEKGGIQARPCRAHGLQSSTLCCLSPHPRLGADLWVLLFPMQCWDRAGRTDTRILLPVCSDPNVPWVTRPGAPLPASGPPHWTICLGQREMFMGDGVSAGIKQIVN